MQRSVLIAAFLLAFCLAGCDRKAEPHSARDASVNTKTSTNIYQVKGVVHDIMPDKNKVKIAHEEIPGYMAAMTMTFDVKNQSELAGIKPGDTVSFRMLVTSDDGWLDTIVKLNTNAPTPVAAAPDAFRRVRDVDPLEIGDTMPDYHFTNELGKAVSLADYKGQSVAITFIFTRCPFPTFCPKMSTSFRDAQNLLKRRADAPTNWHLFTISFDPFFDTPPVLSQYAKRFDADPQRWNFLTGDLIDITAIAEQFGLIFWRPDPKEVTGISHNLRTVVIDARGKVFKVMKENEWKPETLADALIQAANSNPGAKPPAPTSR
ncbi:MAG TPA: SCO family protein [Candidatus Saccharimonadales bacterium]|nr:SCO family protein [Candidatus Saccharimonadales bacterium]